MNAATMPPPMKYSKKKAKQADQGLRIENTGPYIGILTKVKWLVATSGAAGYEFDFKSESGQTADRLSIYTVGKNGQALAIGEAKVAALLCVMGVKEATAVAGKAEEYDFTAGQKVINDVYLFPEAMNKPVGLFLQKETYTKGRGGDGVRMNFECAFRAADQLTAEELIEKKPAAHIAKLVEYLGDKDTRTSGAASTAQYQSAGAQQAAVSDEFDDDIPF